jgi:pterin-4a-carbinolamine dehydratase
VTDPDAPLSRTAASQAVASAGWRYLLGTLCASVPVGSLGRAAEVAAAVVAACGERADRHLRVDLRPDRVELSLQDRRVAALTARDTELAREVTAALTALGAAIAPPVAAGYPRPVQMLEIGIDALDIPAIRPFWKAVLGYADEPTHDGPTTPSSTRPASCLLSGSSRWTRRGRSATGCTWTSPSRTTRRRPGWRRPSRPAGRWSETRKRRPTGCSPTPKATRRASARGRTATSGGYSRARAQ